MQLQPTDIANVATAIALIMASVFLIAITTRMKTTIPTLKRGIRVVQISTMLLGVFLFLHGMFHLSQFLGDNDFWFLYPASIIVLLVFAFYVKAKLFVPSGSKSLFPSDEKGVRAKLKEYSFAVISSVALVGITFVISMVTTLNASDVFSLGGILLAMSLFIWMFIKNPSTQTWHFGFALITVVWSLAEIPYVLSIAGVLSTEGIELFGTWVHFLSMALIGIFVCYRAVKITFTSSPVLQKQPPTPKAVQSKTR